MGTWGTRIYEDDVALDIRGDFLEGRASGRPIADIEQSIKAEYIDDDVPEVNDVVLLALACAELETATLTDETKRAALEVIESGRQYEHWRQEISNDEAGRRKRELTRIKRYLDEYTGSPVKRKSWIELQKTDETFDDADEEEVNEKLDDASWHMQEDIPGISEAEYFARHAVGIACMVHWAIARNYGSARLIDKAGVQQYQAGDLTIFAYVEEYIDGKLFATDFQQGEVRKFVEAYYAWVINEDIVEHVTKERENYSFVATPQELELMDEIIDRRFEEYKADPAVFYRGDDEGMFTTVKRKRSPVKAFWATIFFIAVLIFIIAAVYLILSQLHNGVVYLVELFM
jgi:hypothetical protein